MSNKILQEKKYRERDRKYQMKKRAEGKIDKTQEYKEWREDHPLAYNAHKIFHKALRDGLVSRGVNCQLEDQSCSRVIQAHHPDYSKPLEVVWLCASHHKKVDLGLIKLEEKLSTA